MLYLLFVALFTLYGSPRAHASVGTLPDSSGYTLRPEFQVYLDGPVRRQLEDAWDAKNPRQLERGYCLAAVKVKLPSGDSAWVVARATRAVPTVDTPSSISYDCNKMPSLHVHPPATCPYNAMQGWIWTQCALGGDWGNIGWPSEADYRSADADGSPFEMIQFARSAFIVYFPSAR